ncbi:hypothetical protein BDK92_7152 [Micromonospora pisi]|uniref:Uncharacterized protein n=1 Tax=Micromonospora pisi TaxID=589240 RepID=A0A495JVV7_9ACTN|nr:hypothetical protein [Micromonospora pisi]RKR92675.1 hypothetical protein BDK92_7152 [Micromonospora pisi]
MTDTNERWHLQKVVSERGFSYLPNIPSEYGGHVSVSEPSAAIGPHVWLRATAPTDLNDPNGPTHEAPMHLTADNAVRVAEQLLMTVREHYQADEPSTRVDRVTIERPNDEAIEVWVDGALVASANYDEHGWSGMEAVEKTALAVTRALANGGTGE